MKDKKDGSNKSIKDYIEEITNPIFNKVLLESNNNPMMVGRVQKKEIKFLWQPHNYRLYFNFDKSTFIPPTSKTIYKTHSFRYELKNYGSEHHFYDWESCKIAIKKNMVEVINKSHHKQWRLITANSIPQIKDKIDELVTQLNKQGTSALNSLIRRFGGISDLKIIKVRGEHGIHGIDYLDKIPEDMIIHDTIFKKVYNGKVEFYDPVNIKNTVSNFALKEFSPEISNSLDNLNNTQKEIVTHMDNLYKDVGAMITGMRPTLIQITNLNMEMTKLRKDVTRIQRHKSRPINNKDIRKWL